MIPLWLVVLLGAAWVVVALFVWCLLAIAHDADERADRADARARERVRRGAA
jgi:hypothetical protein